MARSGTTATAKPKAAAKPKPSRQTRAERDYEEIRAYLGDEALERTDIRTALEAQGVAFPARPEDADNQALPTTATAQDDEQLQELDTAVAEMEAAHADRKAANKLRKEKPDEDAAARQAAADALAKLRGQAFDVARRNQQTAARPVLHLADSIGNAPTPGGIPALLLILAALLLILVEIHGQPRLVWFWLVLTGRAHLMSEQKATSGGAATSSAPVAPSPSAVIGTNGNTVAAASHLPPSVLIPSLSNLDRYINP